MRKKLLKLENGSLIYSFKGIINCINIDEILFLESVRRNVIIYEKDVKSTFYGKMDEIMDIMPDNFVRIHQSYAVNINKVKVFNKDSVTIIDERILPLSRSYKNKLFETFGSVCKNDTKEMTWHERKLIEMVNYAYVNSYFYASTNMGIELQNQKELVGLPIIEKRDIIDNESVITPFEYLINKNKYKILCNRTSGSTGKRMDVIWDSRNYLTSMFSLYYLRCKYYGISPKDKLCYFFTYEENSYNKSPFIEEELRLGISKSYFQKENIGKIIEKITLFNPTWMILQPSIASVIAGYIKEKKTINLDGLKYIELTGELCSQSEEEYLRDIFNVHVANQYGAYEVNSIAYECPCGKMHIMRDNVYVEVVDEHGNNLPEGKAGDIVVTSLHNKAMPFIRYNLKDRGVILSSKCKCGNTAKVLDLLLGRASESIEFSDGSKINAYMLDSIMCNIDAVSSVKVLQYRFVHKAEFIFEVHVVIQGNKKIFEDTFKKSINEKHLKKSSFIFKYYDYISADFSSKSKLSVYEKVFS